MSLYCLAGMLRFIGISRNTFHRYEKRKEYAKLCNDLMKIIHTDMKIGKIQKKLRVKD